MKKNGFYLFVLGIFFLTLVSLFFLQFFDYHAHLSHLYLMVANANAQVYLNDQELGSVPIIDYQTLAGFYQLKIVTTSYTYTTSIRLSPKTVTVVDWQAGMTIEESSGLFYELIPLEKNGENQVLVQTLPDRALLIFANSSVNNFTPYQNNQLALTAQTATLSLPGYHDLPFNFTPVAGYQLKITAKLAKDVTEVESTTTHY